MGLLSFRKYDFAIWNSVVRRLLLNRRTGLLPNGGFCGFT